MRVLITGGSGQLGRDLQVALADHDVRAFGHREFDVTDRGAANTLISSYGPDLVVHAAALTDTARCEREPDAAYAINAEGAQHVASACAGAGAAIVYVSTNEVFDGTKPEPYAEDDEPGPVNAYGRSKLAGEQLVRAALPAHYIVRTAWLYGRGGNHFVEKIRRAARGGEVSGVVDEIATPTWTSDLALALAQLIKTDAYGVYHLTNGGQASRYEWVEEILRLAGEPTVRLRPLSTPEYLASLPEGSTAPRKPAYSVLRNRAAAALGIRLRPWHEALARFFAADG